MSVSYFTRLRKSYAVKVLFSAVLTNIFAFGLPIQQIVYDYCNSNDKQIIVTGNGAPAMAVAANEPSTKPGENEKSTTVKQPGAFTPLVAYTVFYAQEKEGVIGTESDGIENPFDNFFTFNLPDTLTPKRYDVTLAYDLYGLPEASQATKSINGNVAYGGKVISKKQAWTAVTENIPAGLMKPGANEVFFNRREGENYEYKVKNLRLEIKKKKAEILTIAQSVAVNNNGVIYISGTVSNDKITQVEIAGETVAVYQGVFEKVLQDMPSGTKEITVKYTQNLQEHIEVMPVLYSNSDVAHNFTGSEVKDNSVFFRIDDFERGLAVYDSLAIGIKKEASNAEGKVQVSGLFFKDLRPFNEDVENVTGSNFKGYNVKKINLKDSIGISLHIKYDESKIPDGYTEKDVKTFYFDKNQHTWKILPVDSLDIKKHEIISTTYFGDTDYINGVIKVPDSPETGSFTPTTISDMSYADPASGVVSIAPPTPNSSGTANTGFPIKLPQGRNGMQPSLQVSYNSEAGNGWMGIGWNLATPAITLNTKWGAPLFNGTNESELYTINGSDLVLKNTGDEYTSPNKSGNLLRATNSTGLGATMQRQFYERKEGSYNKIVRMGDSPSNYYWIVTDKMGNKSFYGGVYNIPGVTSGVDENAVIRTTDNNIAHWALKRTQDPYGNFVEYTYAKAPVSISTTPAVSGQEFYISRIDYTKYGTSTASYYTVAFTRNTYTTTLTGQVNTNLNRADVSINARNGFIQVVDDLLTEIKVSLVQSGQPISHIRTYRFDYNQGPFQKNQLEEISEFDGAGVLFYSNSMEYYNEYGSGDIIGAAAPWTNLNSNDDILSPLAQISPSSLILPKGSPLGTSVSSGFSLGLRAGFGLGTNVLSVSNTVGGSFSYNQDNLEGRVNFIDINGDGLPDKVFKNNNNGIYYRPNLGQSFGNIINITNLSSLETTKSRTTGKGADVNALGWIGIGRSWSKTKSETDGYFADFNGDGLPDMVTGNRVKFNTAGSDNSTYMDRNFTLNASATENTIISGGIHPSLIEDLHLETLDELREEYPQFDHVKVWQAPYTGTVSITSDAMLKHKNDDYLHPNTFKLTVEKGNFNQITSNVSTHFATVLSPAVTLTTENLLISNNYTVSVTKGDMLFFRIHNSDYGYGGEIRWNPIINYTNMTGGMINTSGRDDSGKQLNNFNAQGDFIINNASSAGLEDEDTTVTLNFNLTNQFTPLQFSDDIRFIIKKARINLSDGTETIDPNFTRTRTYSSLTGTFSGDADSISYALATPSGFKDVFYFNATSDSNVNWGAINWKPTISGDVSGLHYPYVSYTTFDDNVNQKPYWFDSTTITTPVIQGDGSSPFVLLSHDFFGQSYASLFDPIDAAEFPMKINWVVKKETGSVMQALYQRTFFVFRTSPGNYVFKKVVNNAYVNLDLNVTDIDFFQKALTKQEIKDIKTASGKIYSTFYIYNKHAGINNNSKIKLQLHSTQPATYNFTPLELTGPFLAYSPNFSGITYRGWGQFLYNGGLEYEHDSNGNITNLNTPYIFGNNPIDISQFNFESLADTAQDVDPNTNPDDVQVQNTAIRYNFYNQDLLNNRYINTGITTARYGYNGPNLTAIVGRFGESSLYNVYIDQADIVLGGSTIFAGLKQRTESKGTATSGNLALVNGTDSNATTQVLNQYIDVNGDRYPDMVTGGKIQYTNMLGGMSSVIKPNSFSSGSNSHDMTAGVTIPIQPNSTSSSNGGSKNKTVTNASSGINGSTGDSSNATQWTDINGDGLPDKVQITDSGVKAWLNTGYGFSANEVYWINSLSGLLTSTRSSGGVGASLSFGASLAAGFGAAGSTANMSTMIFDVNGDGLPDLVRKTTDAYIYYLNAGNKFSSTPNTFYTTPASAEQDYSISGNIFGTFTWGFPIPILPLIDLKVVFTPSAGTSASFSEKRATIQDLNGDGLCDVILKGSNTYNTNITASLNKIGRTHLLRKVNTPLGGSWSLTYERSINTYDMPQSKWLLSSIQSNDGFTGDQNYKPNATLATATYSNPKYDRREREFYGYGTVTIQQKYPDLPQATFRTAIETYHNDNYYLSGAEKHTALYDDQNNLLSESTTLYNILHPDTPVVNFDASASNSYLQVSLQGNAASYLDKWRLFVTVAKVTSTSYEGSEGLTTTKEFTSYDSNGNLKSYIDRGEGPEDAYKTVIEYNLPIAGLDNSVGFPQKISVYKNSSNTLMRYREAAYNTLGKLSMVTTKLNATDNNQVSFVYNSYGNLTTVNDLNNLNSSNTTNFTKSIGYDPVLNTYPVSFDNSFGETSTMVYNYQFGIPVFTTDTNGQSMRTRIDNRGRVLEVTGPNELALETASGGAWTIRMEYEGTGAITTALAKTKYSMLAGAARYQALPPGSAIPTTSRHFALTRHFDTESASGITTTNHLLTVSLVDGFGQPLQIKKTHRTGAATKWMISGVNIQDAFGRTLRTYLPIVDNANGYPTSTGTFNNTSNIFSYIAGLSAIAPTEMTYDAKDRVKTVKQPGETNIASTDYLIEEGMLVQKITNEKGQQLKAYTDVRGRQRKTIQEEITTKFDYNAINELTKVTDNLNFVSEYFYDFAGRKIEMHHPDRGVVTFKYDKASRLTEQSTSNMILAGNQKIQYYYDYARLIRVAYPQNPQNEVKYTYGATTATNPTLGPLATANNAVGRLLVQEDASGMQVFGYGKMGELTKNLRSVAVAGYQSYWFYTQWEYDSWNRIQKITYPDQEVISYTYNQGGTLQSIQSTLPNITNSDTGNQDVVSSITYDDWGDRTSIKYGNGKVTNYTYDARRRMNSLNHNFTGFAITKNYTYDALSNITDIASASPAGSLPANGQIGGPITHHYDYDNYNRLTHAEGSYTGPNDFTTPYLRQQYTLNMEYNLDHTIKKKTQRQWQGEVSSATAPLPESSGRAVQKNSYMLDYGAYGSQAFAVDVPATGLSYGYLQPHAPRTITETPTWVSNPAQDDPRIKTKKILYDANGNQTEIKSVVGEVETSLRKNIWDEENRLRAVNLKPDDATAGSPLAIYTYDAGGSRTVRYNYDRIDVASNATEPAANEKVKDNVMLYPSGLIMGKAKHAKADRDDSPFIYTKHYYIGSERISAKTGTLNNLGGYPNTLLNQTGKMPQLASLSGTLIRTPSNNKVAAAKTTVENIHVSFDVPLPEMTAAVEADVAYNPHIASKLNLYYYHPDHLGSSSYMTNRTGVVCQHMEYLPFGETLVDEHLNSNNSPFKFNGKEFDEETGNYYYAARYYDPKFSIFISVDPLADQTLSAYGYCYNNPIVLADPTGMSPEEPDDFYRNCETGEIEWFWFDGNLDGYESLGTSYNENGQWGNGDLSTGKVVQGGMDGSLTEIQFNGVLNNVDVECYRDKPATSETTWDPVTDQRISGLDTRLQTPATDFINEAYAQGVSLRITQGLRTFEEQNALYSQGRTTPGNIVTNARGGQSYHNYGLAFDVVIMQNGNPVWDRIPADIANIGISHGFEWGGNWRSFKDYPHFQMTFGQSISELQRN